ncbi:hypothetical protein NDU88_000551 [Pleurodeles waltl]|uniref:Secreted protein n=1 Tax=Pleurodeles waltl TaxID=8319 RepID=A0AAV7S4Y1_PLEWA|nr:hypothetical protein NDU88_000551 [Pleurodeles waltl]
MPLAYSASVWVCVRVGHLVICGLRGRIPARAVAGFCCLPLVFRACHMLHYAWISLRSPAKFGAAAVVG